MFSLVGVMSIPNCCFTFPHQFSMLFGSLFFKGGVSRLAACVSFRVVCARSCRFVGLVQFSFMLAPVKYWLCSAARVCSCVRVCSSIGYWSLLVFKISCAHFCGV